jgi:hypothetical protein
MSNMQAMFPDMTSIIAGPLPFVGHVNQRRPVSVFSSSRAMIGRPVSYSASSGP